MLATERKPLRAYLKERREALHLSPEMIAVKTGGAITPSTVRKIEAGHGRPRPETLAVLAEVLKLDYSELMEMAGYLPRLEGVEKPEPSSEERELLEFYRQLAPDVRSIVYDLTQKMALRLVAAEKSEYKEE